VHDSIVGTDLRLTSIVPGVVGSKPICCAKAANLLLARATLDARARGPSAPGGRLRIVRQLVTEVGFRGWLAARSGGNRCRDSQRGASRRVRRVCRRRASR
jgi:hypothetical protein